MREVTWEIAYTPKLCPICLGVESKQVLMQVSSTEQDGLQVLAYRCRVCGFNPEPLCCELPDDAGEAQPPLRIPVILPTQASGNIPTLKSLSRVATETATLPVSSIPKRKCDGNEELMQVAQDEFPESLDIESAMGMVTVTRSIKPIAVPVMGESDPPYGIQISYGVGAGAKRNELAVESIWKGSEFDEPADIMENIKRSAANALKPMPDVVHRVVPQIISSVEESMFSGNNMNTHRGGEPMKVRKRAYTG